MSDICLKSTSFIEMFQCITFRSVNRASNLLEVYRQSRMKWIQRSTNLERIRQKKFHKKYSEKLHSWQNVEIFPFSDKFYWFLLSSVSKYRRNNCNFLSNNISKLNFLNMETVTGKVCQSWYFLVERIFSNWENLLSLFWQKQLLNICLRVDNFTCGWWKLQATFLEIFPGWWSISTDILTLKK